MGCGVSRFQHEEYAELTSKLNPLIKRHGKGKRPFFSKVNDDRGGDELDSDCSVAKEATEPPVDRWKGMKTLEVKTTLGKVETTTKEEGGESSREVDEEISTDEDKEEIEYSDWKDCLKFPASPSFREYCNSDIVDSGGNVDGSKRKIYDMSSMEESPDVDKGSGVQPVKKESIVRRLRDAISRSRQGRKTLLNASCYNPNYASSINNHQKLVQKSL